MASIIEERERQPSRPLHRTHMTPPIDRSVAIFVR
jgi:hypothetical protein